MIYNYLVIYSYTKNNKSGFGNIELSLKQKPETFDLIADMREFIKEKNNFDEVVLIDYKFVNETEDNGEEDKITFTYDEDITVTDSDGTVLGHCDIQDAGAIVDMFKKMFQDQGVKVEEINAFEEGEIIHE